MHSVVFKQLDCHRRDTTVKLNFPPTPLIVCFTSSAIVTFSKYNSFPVKAGLSFACSFDS